MAVVPSTECSILAGLSKILIVLRVSQATKAGAGITCNLTFARYIRDTSLVPLILISSLIQNEKWVEPADGHDTTGEFNPDFHSSDGLVAVSLPGFPQAIDDMVLQASEELGGIFEFNLDLNSGNPLGLSECLSGTA